jgi:hypothetical protein
LASVFLRQVQIQQHQVRARRIVEFSLAAQIRHGRFAVAHNVQVVQR